ncbi:DUF1178 family protein [Paracoccus tegillarcae]|uniref:DUF1178 domain-containing protein n=1 Tax=Paracoccus tegillarcae TaxID=1529068 RepID=A0A2K9EGV8_9RHOB|nr:DUF1178 family protein [Paracoccus tegillarcae]AUH32557.1 DUF1178 domain-containing protein [Paracoccus tegillarcae]
MIRYTLRCTSGHDFDGWFRSSGGFDTLRAAGQVACTICGDTDVKKTLMAPALPAGREATPPTSPDQDPLTTPRDGKEQALQALREHVEANSDYVGLRFADEARAMHEGNSKSRAIHGEARPEEAQKLIEEGVPIAPLPFIPRQKAN